uniref:Uncharacterized protein n=1 Tax=Cacopsylla melanoneura TaxID=428564 RepID=A0A8D8ZJ15_9HEMI
MFFSSLVSSRSYFSTVFPVFSLLAIVLLYLLLYYQYYHCYPIKCFFSFITSSALPQKPHLTFFLSQYFEHKNFRVFILLSAFFQIGLYVCKRHSTVHIGAFYHF